MAKDKDLKTPNVPPLRFPGFSDEWVKVSLGDIGETLIGLTYSPKDVVANDGTIVFRSSNIQDGMIDYTDLVRVNKPIKERIVTRENDILICARNGSQRLIGKNALLTKADEGNTFGAFMMIYRSDDNDVIHPILSTRRYISQVSENLGARINQITTSDLNSFEFYIPSNCIERRKIGKLFALINERIATQNKIIEDLKKLKSAIMVITFGKSNVTKNQWREVRLGNICERVTRRNSNNISNLILTIAAQYGLVSQIDFFNKSVASADLSNYYLLDKGDFAYNKSYSGEYTWGAVKRLDLYPQGVLSPLYICFRPIEGIIDSDFLVYLFESKCWYREVSEICVEGARNHGLLNVSVVDFFNMKLHLPDLSEQKRIAEMMNAISDKIEHSSQLYALYNNQKTYLLSHMFI
ncbi:restriction endonuclease subunit S [uncultured Duncaniella sp.]|jgi:type I restriction enzyme S subunit|uniref:restriction endonuclease subunit S n=1 Tax=uncultured Duncaniella sp. TaxID=2768039 RepID=UPI0025B07614|nr:restriction endonuclease subunit S [uncultured Duncaniella sp.]